MAYPADRLDRSQEDIDREAVPDNIVQPIGQRFEESQDEWRLRMKTFVLLGDEIRKQEQQQDVDNAAAAHSEAILPILRILHRFEGLPSPLDSELQEDGLRSRIRELEVETEKLSGLLPSISEKFWDQHQMIENLVYDYKEGAHLTCTRFRARLYIPKETRFVLPARRGIDSKVELAGAGDSIALGDLADHIHDLEFRSAIDQNVLHIVYTIMEFWLGSPWPGYFSPTAHETDTADLWLYNAENSFFAILHLHSHIPADYSTVHPEYAKAIIRYLDVAPKRFAAYRRHLGMPQFVLGASPAEYTFDIDEVSIPEVDPDGRMDSELNSLLASAEMQRLALESPEESGASTPDEMMLRVSLLSDLRHGLQLRQQLEREPRWRHPEILLAFTDICEDVEKYGDEVFGSREEETSSEILDIWQGWSERVLAILGFRDVFELDKIARRDSPIPTISVTPATPATA